MHVSRHLSPTRLPVATSVLILLILQMLWWASPAQAQGFFQQLFGISSSPQVHSAPRTTIQRQPVGGAPMRFQIPMEGVPSWRSPRENYSSYSGGNEGTGSYTTMCVRMCDGYYFPISHRVPRGRFHRDADVCRSRCDAGDARLFYHSSSGEDMKSAVDLTGRAYARLPIAFMHRKKRVTGCGCRPEPWSPEAQFRHEGYAIAEGITVRGAVVAGGSSRGLGTLTVVAGNYPAPPPEPKPEAADPAGAQDPPASGDTGAASGETPAEVIAQAEPPQPAGKQNQARRSPAGLQKQPGVIAASRSKPTRMASAAQSGSKLVWPGDAR